MATVQIRDVPDEIAKIIAQKANTEHKSVSAYLRDLMAADAKLELQRRALTAWDAELKKTQAQLELPMESALSGADVLREIRRELEV